MIKFPNKEEKAELSEFVDMIIDEIRPKIENAVWAVMLASRGAVDFDDMLDDDDEELDDACDCKRCEKPRVVLSEDDESADDAALRIVIKAKDTLTPQDVERLVEGVQRLADGLPVDKPTKKRKIHVE